MANQKLKPQNKACSCTNSTARRARSVMRHPNVGDGFPFGESKTKGRRARFPKFTTTSRGLQSLDDDRHEKRNVKYYGCLERGHSPRMRSFASSEASNIANSPRLRDATRLYTRASVATNVCPFPPNFPDGARCANERHEKGCCNNCYDKHTHAHDARKQRRKERQVGTTDGAARFLREAGEQTTVACVSEKVSGQVVFLFLLAPRLRGHSREVEGVLALAGGNAQPLAHYFGVRVVRQLQVVDARHH